MGWQQHSWSIAASQWLPAVLNPVWLLLCGSLCFTILEQFLCFEFPFEKEDKVLASRCKILHWDKPQCVFFFQWWPSKWRWTQFSSTVKFQTNIRTVGNLILCSRRAMSRMMALEKKKLVSSECSSRTSRSYIIHIYMLLSKLLFYWMTWKRWHDFMCFGCRLHSGQRVEEWIRFPTVPDQEPFLVWLHSQPSAQHSSEPRRGDLPLLTESLHSVWFIQFISAQENCCYFIISHATLLGLFFPRCYGHFSHPITKSI